MSTSPAVSIIIPVHNDETWIAAALESCMRQSLSDIEVICVDDASTDGTRAIIDTYRARDSRIRLIEQPANASAFQARRVGVEEALAPYVLFLDGDDELTRNAAQVVLERARSEGADVVGFGVDFVMSKGVRKPAFEKEVQPKDVELSGSAILPGLFPAGKSAHGHVWGYLFAIELLRSAYAGLPLDLHLPRANDLPIAFLALARATKYVSTPERAYRYHFRRGTSGQRVTNTDEFEFYLGAVSSIEVIEHKVHEIAAGSDDAVEVLACYESTRLSVIGTVLRYCLNAADEELQSACFALIRARISDVDVIRAAAGFCPDALRLFDRTSPGPSNRAEPVRSVLITTAVLGTGGIQGVIASQARHLVDAGMRVTIAVHRHDDSVYDLPDGVDVIHLQATTVAERLRAWVEICRDSEADVILDHYVLYNQVWPFFALAAQTLGIPTIGFLQSFALRPVRDDNANMSFLVENLPLLETVVTLSATDVANWKLRGLERVVHLPNPPSPMLQQMSTRTVPKSPPAGPVKLIWWGRLQQSTKQARDLIPITAALRSRGVDAELTVIGPDSNDLTAARMLADAVSQGVADHVKIVGALHGPALIEALSDADISLFTSVIEGSPLALVEAQFLGLPVAMYELPWLANLDGNEGVITVRQGDVRGLAREIELLVNDPGRYVAVSQASLEAARRATDFDFPELYGQLLTGTLPASRSPEPTVAHARLLLEWTTFYTELNSRQRMAQSAEVISLRKQIVALRKQGADVHAKFVAQRQATADLRRKLAAAPSAPRFDRRAKRLVARVARKAQSVLPRRDSVKASSHEGSTAAHDMALSVPTVDAAVEVAGRDTVAVPGDDGLRTDGAALRDRAEATARGVISAAQPDVSVVIPVYNAGPWLDQCLSSVLAQRDVGLEVICVNDGSTDDSRSILSHFAHQDSRVRIIDQPNSGQSVGRNAGLNAANGRYVIFLDSDDYWAQDALSVLVQRADADELDVLFLEGHSVLDGNVSDEVWNRYGKYYPRHQEYRETRAGVDMIVDMRRGRDYKAHVGLYLTRTSYIRASGARFIPGIVHQDNPYTFALLLNAGRVAHAMVDLYARRVRPGSTITTLKALNSAKGYYLSYVSMLREVSSRDLSPEVASVLSNVVYDVFVSARGQFVQLPPSIGAELKTLDLSPEGQVAFRLLVSTREPVTAQEPINPSGAENRTLTGDAVQASR
ncbi:glycosyltransferase [Microbacterium sulfonylureivorans]|uniref:glycosyltransferase n=1 Tax=Microbacterium sulfonylureivorans TaxID=2486854 RepID=UPI000FDB78B1|nr:glycosyltransferase [Microbacterium sulfonylureivorans]